MNKEELLAAQKTVTDKFEQLTQEKDNIQAELMRLQGEYRVYEQQLAKLDTTESQAEQTNDASTESMNG